MAFEFYIADFPARSANARKRGPFDNFQEAAAGALRDSLAEEKEVFVLRRDLDAANEVSESVAARARKGELLDSEGVHPLATEDGEVEEPPPPPQPASS